VPGVRKAGGVPYGQRQAASNLHGMARQARILLAEDDPGIAAEIVADLAARGYQPTHVDRGPTAIVAGRSGHFDLIIMDRILPELDGITVIERLREENIGVPVLVLSALGAVDDKVRGLKAGGERRIELLPREFRLLEYLMRRPGQVVTRAMLLEEVWHYRFVPQTNLVDVHVGKLRRKIETDGEPTLIESIRGTGFLFREAPGEIAREAGREAD
jgi:two-component system OmpR family response regulator